jgi:hypothetical protein
VVVAGRRIHQAVGLSIAVGAFWLAWFENVDTDAATGPTNCGPNSLRVLLHGPSRNTDVLTVSACHTAALINTVICGSLFALGIAIAIGRIRRWRDRRFSSRFGPSAIALQRFMLNWRPPYLEIGLGEIHLVLPRYFGKQQWTIAMSQVVFADVSLTTEDEPNDDLDGDSSDELLFELPPRIPFLYTASALGAPNLLLLFRQPQPVLPIRRLAAWDKNVDLHFSRHDSMSPEGDAVLDGVLLKAQDASTAVATLTRAGVEMTTEPDRWLVAHHATTGDPTAIAEAKTEIERAKWIDRVGLGGPLALFAAAFVADKLGGRTGATFVPFFIGAGSIGFIGFQMFVWVLGRRAKRSRAKGA